MSYRHPKFYKEDHGAFMRNLESGFEKAFAGATKHYDDKIAEVDEYENDLMNQAEQMRKEAENMENFSADAQMNLENKIQSFLKEGLAVKNIGKGEGGLFGQKMGLKDKKSQLEIDEANASFNAEIGAINKFSDRVFVENLDLHDDYDKGSATYQEYASIVKGLKNNFAAGGSMDFDYSGDNKFKAGITIPNPAYTPEFIEVPGKPKIKNPDYYEGVNDGIDKDKTYSASEMQRIISENDPEARKAFETRYDTAYDTLEGQAKARLDQVYAQGNAYKTDGKGAAYLGKTAVANVVKEYMVEMKQSDENNPNEVSHIDDIFNNKVNFTDKVRFEVLQNTGGTGLASYADMSAASADNVSMLLDLPHNATTQQKKLLEAIYRREGVTEDKDQWMKKQMGDLENARNGMVERYLNNELMGSGISSKYIKPSTTNENNNPPGGNNDGGGDEIRSSVIATQQSGFQFTEAESSDFAGDDMYSKLADANLLPRGGGNVGKQSWGEWFRGENKQLSQEDFNKMLNNPEQFAAWKQKIEESGNAKLIEEFSTMTSGIVSSKVPTITGTEIDGKRVQNQNFDPESGELTVAFDTEGEDIRTYNMNKLSGDMQLYLDQMGYGDKTGKTIEEGTRKFMEEKMPMLIDNRYNSDLGGSDGMYDSYFDASNAGAGMDKVYQDYIRRKSVADYNDINTGLSAIPAGDKNTPIAITPEITITPSDGIEKIMKQVDMIADKGQGDIYKKVIEKLAQLQNQ